jgi:hypothetical protein
MFQAFCGGFVVCEIDYLYEADIAAVFRLQ